MTRGEPMTRGERLSRRALAMSPRPPRDSPAGGRGIRRLITLQARHLRWAFALACALATAAPAMSETIGGDGVPARAFPRSPLPAELAAARDAPEALAAEALQHLATRELARVEHGLSLVRILPVARLDDATVLRLMASLADTASDPVAPPFFDCGMGMERWPLARFHRVGALLLGLGAQVPQGVLDATRHANPQARLVAMDVLDALPSPSSRARFAELLRDPDPRVRGRAADALDRLRPCGHAETIASLLADPDVDVRRRAAVLLATCGRRDGMDSLAASCDGTWTRASFPPPTPPPGTFDLPGLADCAELARLVTRDLPGESLEARTAKLLEGPWPAPGADGITHLDPGPGFPWRAWWDEHGAGVDALERNVALAVAWQTGATTESHRTVSYSLLERACDEPCLRALSASPAGPRRADSRVTEALERARARLAPGTLAGKSSRVADPVADRGRALEALFTVDRLRARSLQLQLFESAALADFETALRVAHAFPLSAREVRGKLMSWARTNPAGALRAFRDTPMAQDCELARALHPRAAGDMLERWGCGEAAR